MAAKGHKWQAKKQGVFEIEVEKEEVESEIT